MVLLVGGGGGGAAAAETKKEEKKEESEEEEDEVQPLTFPAQLQAAGPTLEPKAVSVNSDNWFSLSTHEVIGQFYHGLSLLMLCVMCRTWASPSLIRVEGCKDFSIPFRCLASVIASFLQHIPRFCTSTSP